jgi:hypothetical protein
VFTQLSEQQSVSLAQGWWYEKQLLQFTPMKQVVVPKQQPLHD